ncbi:unnamed protein product [Clavelina lepadiformis]|uniref:Uncharacterized protein n=1 Tax=Clavelina lepadiformis TaxID=159417 RepID=A0ABP0EYX9_CLALP
MSTAGTKDLDPNCLKEFKLNKSLSNGIFDNLSNVIYCMCRGPYSFIKCWAKTRDSLDDYDQTYYVERVIYVIYFNEKSRHVHRHLYYQVRFSTTLNSQFYA